ncbi:MAG: hypothetical protein M1836_008193 [Candelina mexicana]|nr:MAG: hypothetical protein M1836_008193 [Candelina mexicana]
MAIEMRLALPGGALLRFTNHVEWAVYHAVNADGEIEQTDCIELEDFAKATGCTESLEEVGKFSRAAAKIFVPMLPKAEGSQPLHVPLSGFWFEKEHFVTCAHFLNSDLDENQREQLIQKLKTDEPASVAFTCFAPKITPKNHCNVILIGIDYNADVAVFKMCNPAKLPSGHHWVKSDQIHALTNHEQLEDLRAWIVAYATDENHHECIPDEIRKDWNAAEGSPTNYTLHLKSLKSTLPSPLNKYPPFEHVFQRNRKALTVGKVLKTEPSEWTLDNPSTDEAYIADQVATFRRHNMSGVEGCSGGMVASFRGNDVHEPVVIGMFHGTWSMASNNLYVAFTDKGIRWLRSLVQSTSTPASWTNQPA